jgi:catechol-2,3-dioxygenase
MEQPTPNSAARFERVRLLARDPDSLRAFYGGVLGLPTSASNGVVRVQAGDTALEFARAAGPAEPRYHFAFLIPANQLAAAAEWLAARTTLLRSADGSRDRFHFDFWKADAVYFRDPAGNIGELIAHQSLPAPLPGPFGPSSILHLAEIGLPVADVPAAARAIVNALGLRAFGDVPAAANAYFAPVGDPRGMFIIVRAGRPWWPDEVQLAAPCPVDITVRRPGQPVTLADGPYQISVSTAAT